MSKKAAKIVASAMIDMLYNNIIRENGVETFQGWCEDGDIFTKEYSKEDAQKMIVLFQDITPHFNIVIDKLNQQFNN